MISIRKAEASDIAEVAELFIASQEDALPFLAKLHTRQETRNFIANQVFPQCEVWVALEGKTIVGMMALNDHHLDHLYLLPGSYRRGIGSFLLNQAKRLSPTGLTLFAFLVNTRACAFYEHHGFKVLELGDGTGNEALMPDVLYGWNP
jgi:GNAT superfamily N-acetyltransferase